MKLTIILFLIINITTNLKRFKKGGDDIQWFVFKVQSLQIFEYELMSIINPPHEINDVIIYLSLDKSKVTIFPFFPLDNREQQNNELKKLRINTFIPDKNHQPYIEFNIHHTNVLLTAFFKQDQKTGQSAFYKFEGEISILNEREYNSVSLFEKNYPEGLHIESTIYNRSEYSGMIAKARNVKITELSIT
jgi:hypothetical protein